MNLRSYAHILDEISAKQVPGALDLAPRILEKARQDRGFNLRPRMRLALTVLVVLLSILALTSVAYAIYRLASDPGLQSVQDAGLVRNIGATAQPTIFPTPTAGPTRPAVQIGAAQSLNGATVTLDWIYLDETRLAFGLITGQLPPDLALGDPMVTFKNVTPFQQSWFFRVGEATAEYVSYQVIQAGAVGGKVALSLDVPLIGQSDAQNTALGVFHFDLQDIPVYAGQTIPIQQTYAVRYNGLEARLKSVRVMPSSTEIIACYDFPTADGSFWYMQSATVQVGDGPEAGYINYEYLREISDDHCVKLGFPAGSGSGSASRLIFRIHKLVIPIVEALPAERILAANKKLSEYGIQIEPALDGQSDGPGGWRFVGIPPEGHREQNPMNIVVDVLQEKRTGPWEFYVDIPQKDILPIPAADGLTPTASPPPSLGSQTQGDVTVTLDWAFADARRVAVGYTITGLPDVPEATALQGSGGLGGENGWTDGKIAGGSSDIERVEGRPGVLRGSQSLIFREPLSQKEARFRFQITLGPDPGSNILAQFPFVPEATPYPPGVFPPLLPDHLVGTFTFDFDVPVYPMVMLYPKQKVTANGLEMSLEKVEMSPSYAEVTLCYPKPSARDWMVGGSVYLPELEFAGYTATVNSYSLIYDTDLGGYTGRPPAPADLLQVDAGRCVKIDFLLGNSNQPGTATLTIPDLTQSVPEVISDDEINAAREKLKAVGIEMDYVTYSNGGGAIFKTLPDDMTQQEAYQRYLEALGYVHPGPWVFRFEVRP